MLVRETKMNQIVDAEKQWRLRVRKDIKDLNANPFIINLRNGLYNVRYPVRAYPGLLFYGTAFRQL
jgi:hypothetical protein